MITPASPDSVAAIDSLVPAHVMAKNGFYRVGADVFNHKIHALAAATRTKQPVTWEFGNKVWDNLDWKTNDGLGVLYWYRQRAHQLRDTYDYLILAFSGGADSSNIANVFMSENLKIDEVWCDQPLNHIEDYKFNTQDVSASNMPSEWQFAIKPQLNRIKQLTDWKITLTDSLAAMSDEDSEDTLEISQYAAYTTVKRWRALDDLVKKANATHKRVGVIVGIEKPNFKLINGVLCSYFMDQAIQYSSEFNSQLQREVEFFYWSTDMPQLVRSQCHAVANYVKANPQFINNIRSAHIGKNQVINFQKNPLVDDIKSENFRSMLNYCIYPFWNHDTFQVVKSRNKLYHNEFYDWTKFKFLNHRAFDSHRSNLDNTLTGISREFFSFDRDNKTPLTYQPFVSRYYPIVRLGT